MPVVDMHLVFYGFVSKLVSFAVVHAPLNASARHPHAEALVVVIPSVVALSVRGASKLSAPDDQGVFEHISLFEVLEKSGDGLIRCSAITLKGSLQVAMVIPTSIADLDKAHSCLGETASEQTLLSKTAHAPVAVDSVGLADVAGLVIDFEKLRNLILHAESEFKGLDGTLDLGVVEVPTQLVLIHRLNEIQLFALERAVEVGVVNIVDRLLGSVALASALDPSDISGRDLRALIDGREERGAVVSGAPLARGRVDGDETGKVFVLGAQSVESPGTE